MSNLTAEQRAVEMIEDIDNLRHMLGARPTDSKRDWGYRNYYCANLGDESMASCMRGSKASPRLRIGSTFCCSNKVNNLR